MQASYEYIFAAIVIFAMLAATVTTMLPLADVNLSGAYEYQLEVIADRVLNKILRTPGYPLDWGLNATINSSDTSNLKDFGLALAGAQSSYVLDASKVTRIEQGTEMENLYYIPPQVAAQLLGLGSEYGFALSILPALNISVTSISQNSVSISVTTQESIPAPNANVSATAIWLQQGAAPEPTIFNATTNGTTDWRGRCVLQFPADLESKGKNEGTGLIILVNFYGIETVEILGAAQSLMGYVTGRYLTVVYTIDPMDVNASWIITGEPIMVVYPNVFAGEILNGSNGRAIWVINKGSKTYRVYELAWIDPYTNFIVLEATHQGSYRLAVVARPPRVRYQTGPVAGLHRVTISRLVTINGLTQYVRFSIWRMSE